MKSVQIVTSKVNFSSLVFSGTGNFTIIVVCTKSYAFSVLYIWGKYTYFNVFYNVNKFYGFQHLVSREIFGVHVQRICDPQIRTRPRFFYNEPTPKFYHLMFTSSEVTVLTNTQTHKQTDTAENIQRHIVG